METAVQRVEEALRRIGSRQRGKMWQCPAHEDEKPSLSVGAGDDGRALLKCFAGCGTNAIVSALDLKLSDLFDEPRRDQQRGGVPGVVPPGATAQHRGLVVEQLAEAKGLPPAFLDELGLMTIYYENAPAVKIPYLGEDGAELAARFRVRLNGDRFRWKKGSKPELYGLWRLEEARAAGRVCLVEGETDTWTLWLHDVPALGVPGAAMWNDERHASLFDGIERVLVMIEPDRGGATLEAALAESRLRDRVSVVRLEGHKDVNELHVAHPTDFRERLDAVLAGATPITELRTLAAEQEAREAWEACGALASRPNILDAFIAELRANGVAGEESAAKILYLAITSRLLERPVSVVVKGPSSAGKSFLVQQVVRFFPEQAVYALTGMSERALVYSEESLSHRMLLLYEAAGLRNDFTTYLVRSLLSEGRVRYETVESTSDGLRPRKIERPGPTGVVITTTALALEQETETRLLSVDADDSSEQTGAVLRAIARGGSGEPPDFTPWHALQQWLALGEGGVEVPFAEELARHIPSVDVRLRRDFSTLLGLVRAHALLHRASRPRDQRERVVATLEDYRAVHALVAGSMAESLEQTVPAAIQSTVTVVRELNQPLSNRGIALSVIAKHLGIDKSSASRRCRAAQPYIRNLETRRGAPARFVLGEPLPDDQPVLPDVSKLEAALHRCTQAKGESTHPPAPPGESLESDLPPKDDPPAETGP